MIKIYGIKNCDAMKKAFAWLAAHNLPYEFHDYKKSGISAEQLAQWSAALGWEVLLNRRGSTWRQLPPATQAAINDSLALRLMQENPSLIKRPVLHINGQWLCGFTQAEWEKHGLSHQP